MLWRSTLSYCPHSLQEGARRFSNALITHTLAWEICSVTVPRLLDGCAFPASVDAKWICIVTLCPKVQRIINVCVHVLHGLEKVWRICSSRPQLSFILLLVYLKSLGV